MFNRKSKAVGTREVSDPLWLQFLSGLFVGVVFGVGLGSLLGILG